MTEQKSAAIIGLGLIGGSLARDLASLGWRVMGHDSDASTVKAATQEGVVRAPLDASLSGVRAASVIVVATPVPETRETLEAIARHASDDALVMDVGSTKHSAIEAAEAAGLGPRFVGSHPMAGSHLAGWSAGKAGLFKGATVYLCRTPVTRSAVFARAVDFWTALGGVVEEIDAVAHDTRVAFTSHVPHAVAAALARAMSRASISHGDLGPGGRDVLRLAASSPELWSGIMLDNAEAMLAALEGFGLQIEELRNALRRGDEKGVTKFLTQAREWTRA